MESSMVPARIIGQMVQNIPDSGKKVSVPVRVPCGIPTAIAMRASGRTESVTDREPISMPVADRKPVNGLKASL